MSEGIRRFEEGGRSWLISNSKCGLTHPTSQLMVRGIPYESRKLNETERRRPREGDDSSSSLSKDVASLPVGLKVRGQDR